MKRYRISQTDYSSSRGNRDLWATFYSNPPRSYWESTLKPKTVNLLVAWDGKSLWHILRGPWLSVQNFMEIHHSLLRCLRLEKKPYTTKSMEDFYIFFFTFQRSQITASQSITYWRTENIMVHHCRHIHSVLFCFTILSAAPVIFMPFQLYLYAQTYRVRSRNNSTWSTIQSEFICCSGLKESKSIEVNHSYCGLMV